MVQQWYVLPGTVYCRCTAADSQQQFCVHGVSVSYETLETIHSRSSGWHGRHLKHRARSRRHTELHISILHSRRTVRLSSPMHLRRRLSLLMPPSIRTVSRAATKTNTETGTTYINIFMSTYARAPERRHICLYLYLYLYKYVHARIDEAHVELVYTPARQGTMRPRRQPLPYCKLSSLRH